MACWTQQNTAPWCLFNSITREVSSIDVNLGHSLLKAIGKELGKEEAQLDCFDRSYI